VLYIVGTPIGNLEDISTRALRILKECDLIFCEDTRRTKKLLSHYKINTLTQSYHQHSRLRKKQKILALLKDGKEIALVSDAGMPGISDPGGKLICFLKENLPDLRIAPIPGPSAITAIASVSGFPMDSFLFLGFAPKKKGRTKFFEKIAVSEQSVIFFESPYRIMKTLEELRQTIKERRVVVGRELTKKFEKVYYGSLDEIVQELQDEIRGDHPKGEFTIAIAPS